MDLNARDAFAVAMQNDSRFAGRIGGMGCHQASLGLELDAKRLGLFGIRRNQHSKFFPFTLRALAGS
jgi:hypothetical protein